jgi:hypothetical protein
MDFSTPRRGVLAPAGSISLHAPSSRAWRDVPNGGVVKNNVKIAVTLAVAIALFFLVKHFFPLRG